uniref:Uncharacterized protein n=1 Tax=viral metagenome TaxID=1070528 RepID=A0A6C0B250_9ZZZZ
MDDKRVDRIFFGPETAKSLKQDIRVLTKLLSVIDNDFKRKLCEQTLKGKCLQEKRFSKTYSIIKKWMPEH